MVQAVPGLDEAAVTLLDDEEPFTAASTSELVARLDGVKRDAPLLALCTRAVETA